MFLLLAYYFSRARIGAFLHNDKAEVTQEDGRIDRLVFEGLTVEGKTVPLPPRRCFRGTDSKPGRPYLQDDRHYSPKIPVCMLPL